MLHSTVDIYRCPYTGAPLRLADGATDDCGIVSGRLVTADGRSYPIADGIPSLIDPDDELLGDEERRENAYYQASSRSYDDIMDWVFRSFREDEATVRGKMIGLLDLKPSAKVLETGAGTCRDSIHIARRLGAEGELYVQDLSSGMLALGRTRLEAGADGSPSPCRKEYFVGNAATLPFADDHFDSAFHFGGLNLFTDRKKAIAEMARVVLVGGKVVFGDEGIAPWLRNTPHGEVLMNSNRLYRYAPPIELLPENARDGAVRWLLGGAYWLIDFEVGDGPPRLDLDLPILGRRGGTHRTRMYGVLEGVTVEAKRLAEAAAADSGLTLHAWLDRAVRAAAAPDSTPRGTGS